jgi:hypothetical protein
MSLSSSAATAVPSAPAQAGAFPAVSEASFQPLPAEASTLNGRTVETVTMPVDRKACEEIAAKKVKENQRENDRINGMFVSVAISVAILVLGMTLTIVTGNPLCLLVMVLAPLPPMIDFCIYDSLHEELAHAKKQLKN